MLYGVRDPRLAKASNSRKTITTDMVVTTVWITAPTTRPTMAAGAPGMVTPGLSSWVTTIARAANGSSTNSKIVKI